MTPARGRAGSPSAGRQWRAGLTATRFPDGSERRRPGGIGRGPVGYSDALIGRSVASVGALPEPARWVAVR